MMRSRRLYWPISLALGISILALLAWMLAAGPVLIPSRFSMKEYGDIQALDCRKGVGIFVLNPFRSRAPEQEADVFLRAASKDQCAPGVSSALCAFVHKRPLPGRTWKLVDRWEHARQITLFYIITSDSEGRPRSGCMIAQVELKRTGRVWEVVGFGR
jgi:hypothetical protein